MHFTEKRLSIQKRQEPFSDINNCLDSTAPRSHLGDERRKGPKRNKDETMPGNDAKREAKGIKSDPTPSPGGIQHSFLG